MLWTTPSRCLHLHSSEHAEPWCSDYLRIYAALHAPDFLSMGIIHPTYEKGDPNGASVA